MFHQARNIRRPKDYRYYDHKAMQEGEMGISLLITEGVHCDCRSFLFFFSKSGDQVPVMEEGRKGEKASIFDSVWGKQSNRNEFTAEYCLFKIYPSR